MGAADIGGRAADENPETSKNPELRNPKFETVVFFVELGSTRHCDQTALIYLFFKWADCRTRGFRPV